MDRFTMTAAYYYYGFAYAYGKAYFAVAANCRKVFLSKDAGYGPAA